MMPIKLPNPQDILFLRGDINYTEFHLVNGKKMVSSFTLLRHQEKLGSFIRVSKNHLVNPDYVKEMEHFGVYASLKMVNGNLLKISRRRINYVKNSIYGEFEYSRTQDFSESE